MESGKKRDVDAPVDRPAPSIGVTGAGHVYDGYRNVLAKRWSRRGFIETLGLTGATLVAAPLASQLLAGTAIASTAVQDFCFAVLADSHTMGEKNPLMKIRLEAAIRQINAQ